MCFYCAAAETSSTSTTSVSEGRVFSLEIIADPSALMMCKWASDTATTLATRAST